MKQSKVLLLAFSLIMFTAGLAAPAFSAEMNGGSLTILSPKNGEVFNSGAGVRLTYDVHLSPMGNHVHIYVDGQPPIISRAVTGCPCSVTLPALSAGMHEVDVKEATVSHVLTGLQTSVKFTVK